MNRLFSLLWISLMGLLLQKRTGSLPNFAMLAENINILGFVMERQVLARPFRQDIMPGGIC